MKRKLLLLDLVLAALVVVLGARVRDAWLEARKREQAVLGHPLKPLPPPPYAPLQPAAPATAAAYAEVAQQMLFSADRNPTVIIDVPPPPKMPDLPVLYGIVDLGDGPLAIMSVKSGARHEEIHAGGKVGEFTLLALDTDEITLEWQGKKISKKVVELVDRRPPAAPASPEPTRAGAAPPAASVTKSGGPPSIGSDMGGGLKSCTPGDTTAAGTVTDGYRKVVTQSPFGQICRWEPAR